MIGVRILDIACGSGLWMVGQAYQHSDEYFGVDPFAGFYDNKAKTIRAYTVDDVFLDMVNNVNFYAFKKARRTKEFRRLLTIPFEHGKSVPSKDYVINQRFGDFVFPTHEQVDRVSGNEKYQQHRDVSRFLNTLAYQSRHLHHLTIEDALQDCFEEPVAGRLSLAINRVHYIRGDAITLPFVDRSVDVVVGCGFPERLYIPDGSAWKEAERVLRNGKFTLLNPGEISTNIE